MLLTSKRIDDIFDLKKFRAQLMFGNAILLLEKSNKKRFYEITELILDALREIDE